jgi:phosphoribosylformylglycinamidine synthase subunit PurQ / glutaminase
MKFGVVIFPGSNCDDDMIHVLETVMQQEVVRLWHKEETLPNFEKGDCIILPGGFSYGDYMRAGAISRFSPIMNAVIEFANNGGFVWGICNGFQILCEAGLLPGVLLRNSNQKFICKNVYLKTKTNNSAITSNINLEQPLKIPIAHADGRYFASEAALNSLAENDQILFTYCDEKGNELETTNLNGSARNIAGICNENRNVFGMMPHPERASESILGNSDGKVMFESMVSLIKASLVQ